VRFVTFVVLLCAVFSWNLCLAADPVQGFIAEADSIANAGSDEAFADYVAANPLLVGAVVRVVIDVAMQTGDLGDDADEKENLLFAERVSRLYNEQTGSKVLVDLVATYRKWTPDQRNLRREAKALEARAKTIRNQGIQTGDATKYAEAAALLDQVVPIYSDIGDDGSIAVLWGSLGVVHFYAQDFQAAEESYQKALEARRAIEDRILEGRTLNALGSVNFKLNRWIIARDYYRQAVALRTETGDWVGLGSSLTYLGNTYQSLGRLGDARDSLEEGLVILERLAAANQLYENLNSLGGVYFDMGRLQASNDAYARALDIAIQSRNILGEIKCRNNIALNLRTEYRYTEALRHLEAVESLLERNRDPQEVIAFYRNACLTYMDVGDLDEAKRTLRAFYTEAQKQQSVVLAQEALLQIGYLHMEEHAYDRGLQTAEKLRETAVETDNRKMIREADKLTAELERLRGRYDEALVYWDSALEIDQEAGLQVLVLEDKLGIANNHVAAGRAEKGREIYFAIRPDIVESGQPNLVLNLNLGIAHSYQKTHPDSSVYYNERVLTFLEATRETLEGDNLRSDFLGGWRRYYYEEIARYYASVAMADPKSDWSSRAFVTVERAKGRGLLDHLQSTMLSQESPEESELLDALHRVGEESPDYKELNERYEAARDERLRSSVAGLASAKVVGIDQVQESLPKNTIVLAYALGDSASLLWAIDRNGHELFELPSREGLRMDIQRLRDALARPGAGDVALRRSARRLYEQLVLPAESRMKKAKKLVIVPDGALFEIPFEVLLTEDIEENSDWGELPFLARSYSPVYAPSVSIYLNLIGSRAKRKHDLDLLAVGDPDFTTLSPRGGATQDALEALPYTRDEVLTISAQLDDDRKDILLGEDASEARLKQELRQSSPRLLHLATHGLVDPVEPSASSIALGADEGEDGYLYTMEILALPLAADLVVLSACESGRGKVSRSEGVVGLSRAFMASGASGIVASLWAVSDESTSVLMKEFYNKMLNKKKPAGEALNEARFALLNSADYSHPFYWSPFIVIGSERSPW
jgi:CHAT domain-containing protein